MSSTGNVSGHSTKNSERRTTTTTTSVPEVQLVSIEHPCIVKSFDNGFRSLGGEQQVKHILEDDSDQEGRARKAQKTGGSRPTVGVSLRPHDPMAKKLESSPTTTNSILVKVTLPKWTGRKRKLGTNEPFTAANTDGSSHCISAPDLIRRLQDNTDKYEIAAVGKVQTSHRFDTLPDLHTRDRDVPVMQELKQHAMTPNYDVLKQFKIDLTPGTAGITALPRPLYFIPPDIDIEDPSEADRTSKQDSAQQAPKTPKTPKPSTQAKYKYKPDTEVPAAIKATVDAVSQLLETRPIVTRLCLQHTFPDTPPFRVENAASWVATRSKHGPWRDCLVKRGIDPTSDPQYRIYQIAAFKLPQSLKSDNAVESHVFDGRTRTKARTYQYYDVTDPTLSPLVNTPVYRSKEDGYGGPHLGWYYNGTVAKMKVVIADKLKRMHSATPMLDEQAYAAVAALPDKIEDAAICEVDGKVYGAEARALGAMVRKEALRLLNAGSKDGEGAKEDAVQDGDEGDEEDAEGEEEVDDFAIDPALMADEGQRADSYGNSLTDGAAGYGQANGGFATNLEYTRDLVD